MKVAVWGAGNIGSALVYRLATTPFISEIAWINRTLDKIIGRAVDIEHGLAFAPACHSVTAFEQSMAAQALRETELLILTLGESVGRGQSRADLYPKNREMFRESIVPALAGYEGLILVVSNPVDLLARLVQKEAGLPSSRVIGLGTVVETARLRAALSGYLSPWRPAREVWAWAIGTHDEHFVPVVKESLGVGAVLKPGFLAGILGAVCEEVGKAAARVKLNAPSTLHPIVEGAAQVVEALATDRQTVLTVSVHDPEKDLYYSLPATLDRRGVRHIHRKILDDPKLSQKVERCVNELRRTLQGAGEA